MKWANAGEFEDVRSQRVNQAQTVEGYIENLLQGEFKARQGVCQPLDGKFDCFFVLQGLDVPIQEEPLEGVLAETSDFDRLSVADGKTFKVVEVEGKQVLEIGIPKTPEQLAAEAAARAPAVVVPTAELRPTHPLTISLQDAVLFCEALPDGKAHCQAFEKSGDNKYATWFDVKDGKVRESYIDKSTGEYHVMDPQPLKTMDFSVSSIALMEDLRAQAEKLEKK